MSAEHRVGVALGHPVGPNSNDMRPRWHGICTCGWTGSDSAAVPAQNEALSHAAGHEVHRTVLKLVTHRDEGSRITQRSYRLEREG